MILEETTSLNSSVLRCSWWFCPFFFSWNFTSNRYTVYIYLYDYIYIHALLARLVQYFVVTLPSLTLDQLVQTLRLVGAAGMMFYVTRRWYESNKYSTVGSLLDFHPCAGHPVWASGNLSYPHCSPEPWKSWLGFGKSSPFMAQQFRLVNYYNLPRLITSNTLW